MKNMPPISNIKHSGVKPYIRLCLDYAWLVIRDLIFKTETRSAEASFGAIAIGWWLVLSFSPAFWAGNLYDYLLVLADQTTWGLIMLILGTQQIIISVFAQKTAWIIRAIIWTESFIVWSYIAGVSFLAVPVTTAAAVYPVLAFGSAWAFLRSLER